MGLGKTVIAIALMLANPPPLHRRALPREHLLTKGSDFPGFASLPRAGIQQDCRISNGTLVIVPMTLLRYANTTVQGMVNSALLGANMFFFGIVNGSPKSSNLRRILMF